MENEYAFAKISRRDYTLKYDVIVVFYILSSPSTFPIALFCFFINDKLKEENKIAMA